LPCTNDLAARPEGRAYDVWRWDLFAVAATMAAVKLAAMAWYRLTD
jgi:hypothetical protein